MTQYIMWSKTIDTKFRAAYLEKTKTAELPGGEKIQDTPLESEDGLSYMVGSWRVSETHLGELKADTSITTKATDIKTSKDTEPVGWVRKAEPDE